MEKRTNGLYVDRELEWACIEAWSQSLNLQLCVPLFINDRFMRCANHYILFLFTFYIAPQLFQNWVCMFLMALRLICCMLNLFARSYGHSKHSQFNSVELYSYSTGSQQQQFRGKLCGKLKNQQYISVNLISQIDQPYEANLATVGRKNSLLKGRDKCFTGKVN